MFDHALRIRLKAEIEDDTPAAPPANIAPGPLATNGDTETPRIIVATIEDNEPAPVGQAMPEAGVDAQSAHSQTATAISVASTTTTVAASATSSVKGKGDPAGKTKEDKKGEKKGDSLIGTSTSPEYGAPLIHRDQAA